MAPDREGDDAVSSKPLAEETTTNKKQKRVTISSETLAPPSLPPPLSALPFELVVEILCRLPVKPLVRFRCVCKSWKSLISDPEFAKKHLRCSPTDLSRHHVILNCVTRLREITLTAYPLQSVFKAAVTTAPATQLQYPLDDQNRLDSIVGSCDGIFCLDIDHHNFAVLWNPSTQRFQKLPSLGNPPLEEEEYLNIAYGFGYDHFADRYKVVAVFCYECDDDDDVDETQVKVHTLGTDSWRSIQEFPSGVPNESGKFVSGTLNWLKSVDSKNWVVVSLDLREESYQELVQPVNRYREVNMTFEVVLTLGVLRDCLCIIANHDVYFDKYSDVWLMKEYGDTKSWTKLFSIRTLSISYPILHMSEDDKVLLELEDSLVLYNSRDDTFKTTQIQKVEGLMMTPEVYVESLISPCSLF